MYNGFVIKTRLPGMNEIIKAGNGRRDGYNPLNDLKQDTQAIIKIYARQAMASGMLRQVDYPVEIWITWTEADHRRDVDNIQAGAKFILDALHELGVITNDSPRYVTQIYHKIEYGETAKVEVRLA